MKRPMTVLLPSLVFLLGSVASAAPQLAPPQIPDEEDVIAGAPGQISQGGISPLAPPVFTVTAGKRLQVGGLVAQCAKNDSVTLSTKGGPPSSVPSFSSNPVPSNQFFIFYLKTDASTPPGTYKTQILGKGTVCGRYNPYTFKVQVQAP